MFDEAQERAELTKISPFPVPPEVVTVKLLKASCASINSGLMADCPAETAPSVITTSAGSSSTVPLGPVTPRRSTMPVKLSTPWLEISAKPPLLPVAEMLPAKVVF